MKKVLVGTRGQLTLTFVLLLAGGAGLGLALSSAIARAHSGELRLIARPGPGAVFQLHLPDRSGVETLSPR